MKVLDENKGYNVECTCGHCHSELEVNTFDLKIGLFTVYFICPVCKRKIYVPDEYLELFGIEFKH